MECIERIKNRTKMKYIGYTYFIPALFLPLWRKVFCCRHWHLWDEILSDEHYLYCDACGLTLHIGDIEG